jgi:hypothetical protein
MLEPNKKELFEPGKRKLFSQVKGIFEANKRKFSK